MNKIWTWAKGLIIKNKLIIVAIVAIVSLFLLNKFNYNRYIVAKQENVRLENNLHASEDTIRLTKNKAKESEYDKLAYLGTVKQLTTDKNNLVAEIKKVKGDVKILEKIGSKITHDTTKLVVETNKIDGVLVINSRYDSVFSQGNYRSLALKHYFDLQTNIASGTIVKDEIGFTAITGLKKTDLGYEIFVTPKYPGMRITELEGAVLDPNIFAPKTTVKGKTPWLSVGGHIGYSPFAYDIFAKKLDFRQRIVGSVGVNFDLLHILSITKN